MRTFSHTKINFVQNLLLRAPFQNKRSVSSKVSAEDLAINIFGKFPKLKYLQINNILIFEIDYRIKKIPHEFFLFRSTTLAIPKLKELHLDGCCVKDPQNLFENLSSLETLTSLSLSNLFVKEDGIYNTIVEMKKLGNLKNLRTLFLKNIDESFKISLKSDFIETLILETPLSLILGETDTIGFNNLKKLVIRVKNDYWDKLYYRCMTYKNLSINHGIRVMIPQMILKGIEKIEIIEFYLHDFIGVETSLRKQSPPPRFNYISIDSVFLDANHSFKNLEELRIPSFGSYDGRLFGQCGKSLKKLNIMGNISIIPDNLLQNLDPNTLKELNISFCVQNGINDTFLSCFPLLEKLIMKGCYQVEITNEGFEFFKKLRFLDISYCTQKGITEELLFSLFKNNLFLEGIRILKKYVVKDHQSIKSSRIERVKVCIGKEGFWNDFLDFNPNENMENNQLYFWWVFNKPELMKKSEIHYVHCENPCGVVSITYHCKCDEKYCSNCIQFEKCDSCQVSKLCKKNCIIRCDICKRIYCTKRCAFNKISYCCKCEIPFCKETCGVGFYFSEDGDSFLGNDLRSIGDGEYGDGLFCNNCKE